MVEDERSLQKRPELNPDLLKGGLIIGGDETASGSLISMTGMALERITRERVGTPPGLRLPERPVYLLDANSRRLIMISNREPAGSPKGGLFGEVVQLDEEGKPHYYLDSSNIILPDETFQAVAVGPNEFRLPPSHIDVMDMDEEGKKKFVPWNTYLNRLENWMNQIRVDEGDDFQSFMQRFLDLKRQDEVRVRSVTNAFPASFQSIDDKMVPLNFIIAEGEVASSLSRASAEAGFFPVVMSPEELATSLHRRIRGELQMPELMAYHLSILLPLPSESRGGDPEINRWLADRMREYIQEHEHFEVHSQYSVAVVTADERSIRKLYLDKQDEAAQLRGQHLRDKKNEIYNKYGRLLDPIGTIIQYNRIFSTLTIPNWIPESQPEDVEKQAHGRFFFPPDNEDLYRRLLNKIKADLFLTMFLRGGAPIVK